MSIYDDPELFICRKGDIVSLISSLTTIPPQKRDLDRLEKIQLNLPRNITLDVST